MPDITGSGVSLIHRLMSASAPTVVWSEAILLPPTGSVVVDLVCTLFVLVPRGVVGGTVYVAVIVARLPTRMFPRAQVKFVGLVVLHAP